VCSSDLYIKPENVPELIKKLKFFAEND
jgi:hypothetical protein